VTRTFRFRLQPVLEHRERREQLCQVEFSRAVAAAASQRAEAERATADAEERLVRFRDEASASILCDDLRRAHEELERARARAAHERASADRLEEVARARQAEMVEASREAKAMSRLRETHRSRHAQAELRAETAMLDEIATTRTRPRTVVMT